MSEKMIYYFSGYLENKLSKRDMLELLNMIRASDAARKDFAIDAFVDRLLNASACQPASTDLIMNALPTENNMSERVLLSIINNDSQIEKSADRPEMKSGRSKFRFHKKKVHAARSGIDSRKQRKGRVLPFFKPLAATAAAAAAILLVAGLWKTHFTESRNQPDPHISAEMKIIGDVSIIRAGRLLSFDSAAPLMKGDTVQTRNNARAVIRYIDDGSCITLQSNGRLTLDGPGPAKVITLESGSLVAGINRQNSQSHFTFATPQVDIRVLGTQFMLKSAEAQSHLKMTAGKVRLTRRADEKSVIVNGGEYIVVDDSLPLSVGISRDFTVGHMQVDQVSDMKATMDSALALGINLLTYDSKKVDRQHAADFINAVNTARANDVSCFVRIMVPPEDCLSVNRDSAVSSHIKTIVGLISEYDFDGIYFIVNDQSRETSELLSRLEAGLAARAPGISVLAGIYDDNTSSSESWRFGY